MKDKIIADILDGRSLFLTGGAGTGKTYLLNEVLNDSKIAPIRLASTGISAHLIEGETVHRFFRFGISKSIEELKAWDIKMAENFSSRSNNVDKKGALSIILRGISQNLQFANVIVIDEVSMLSKCLIDMIYYRLSQFGSCIPILFSGDFYQLPPVNKDYRDMGYAFDSKHWDFKTYYLKDIKRTDNKDFESVQLKIREGIIDDVVLGFLKGLNFETSDSTLNLFSTNKEIDIYNNEKLRNLEGKFYKVSAKWDSSFIDQDILDFIDRDLLINKDFVFKMGAKVILLNNSLDSSWYNGESGIIKGFEDQCFIILKENGKEVRVPRFYFKKEELVKGRMETKLCLSHYPLKIGYAISIHKAQGLTLTEGLIDCKRFFLPQQFYVALSRFKDSTRIKLLNFQSGIIERNNKVYEFYQKLENG